MTNEALHAAETLFAEGRLSEAKALLAELLVAQPQNTDALDGLAAVAWQEGDKPAALGYASKALEVDPYHREALRNYATMLEQMHALGLARDLLANFCARNPNDREMAALFSQVPAAAPQPGPMARPAKTLAEAKVLHAPYEVGGCINRFSRFLRQAGVDATGANYYDSWFRYRCDINLGIGALPPEKQEAAVDVFAREAMERYDIFHFHFANSLYPDLRELEHLRQRGKKILFSFWGSDSRAHEVLFYHQAKFLGYNPPRPYFNTIAQYAALKRINQYADVLLGFTCIPRYLFFPGFVDTQEWGLEEKRRLLALKLIDKDPQKLYVLHAPSVGWKKGSSYILPVLEKMKAQGLPLELLYISGVEPEEAKRLYAYADVVVDQVSIGTFGLFAIEMMCWETPVLVYHTPFHDRTRDYPPVLKVNTQQDLEQMLERAIAMKATGELAEIGRQSRRWALEHTDVRPTITELVRIYGELLEGRTIPQHVDLGWYQQEQRLQKGEKSDFYRYMREEGVFRAMGATLNEYDKRLYT